MFLFLIPLLSMICSGFISSRKLMSTKFSLNVFLPASFATNDSSCSSSTCDVQLHNRQDEEASIQQQLNIAIQTRSRPASVVQSLVVVRAYECALSHLDLQNEQVQQQHQYQRYHRVDNAVLGSPSECTEGEEAQGLLRVPPSYALIFVPATVIDSVLADVDPERLHQESPFLLIDDQVQQFHVSKRVLQLLHPFLVGNFHLLAIILRRGAAPPQQPHIPSQEHEQQHIPSDMVLLDLSHTPPTLMDELLEHTYGQMLHSGPEAVLKVLLIDRVGFEHWHEGASEGIEKPLTATSHMTLVAPRFSLPTCPVCLHRVDPWRLGLPRPHNDQLCSKFCTPPNLTRPFEVVCSRQRLLQPWPIPSYCVVCHNIQDYWSSAGGSGIGKDLSITSLKSLSVGAAAVGRANAICCATCSMQETLWVCLTCGFVGCGRYSNKHALEHFYSTQHPLGLELSTLRIWDYVGSEFAHRLDLLECPSSPPLLHSWIPRSIARGSGQYVTFAGANVAGRSLEYDDNNNNSHDVIRMSSSMPPVDKGNSIALGDCHDMDYSTASTIYGTTNGYNLDDGKSPKKAMMIGEEYEALLHSALEEQAQHYEGEISRLRAALTAQHVDETSFSQEEVHEVNILQQEIQQLRMDIDRVSHELLQWQSQEAGHRATSQRLLREQQIAQDLLETIRAETKLEHQQGRSQMDELEQQIADLTTNERMRHQFLQDEDLMNAQIVATTSTTPTTTGSSHNNNMGLGSHATTSLEGITTSTTTATSSSSSTDAKPTKNKGGKKMRRFFRK